MAQLLSYEYFFFALKGSKLFIIIRGFRPGPTQTGLYSHRRWLEAYISDLGSRGITLSVTAKLICVFVFAYAKIWFSHDAAHISRLISKNFAGPFVTN